MKVQISSLKRTVYKAVVLVALLTGSTGALSATHGEADYASTSPETVSYKITDGYGEYTGHGSTQIQAASHAREACIMQKITAYENRFGVTPDADTADMFIDACINR